MGLREKARKSLEKSEPAEEDELDLPVLVKVDIDAIEAEAKARETHLRKELDEARKLSEAKTSQIVRQETALESLEARVKASESTAKTAERDAARALKRVTKEIEKAIGISQHKRTTKPAAPELKSANVK